MTGTRSRRSPRKASAVRLHSTALAVALVGGLLAGISPGAASAAGLAAPPVIQPLPPIDPGPDQSMAIPRTALELQPPVVPTPLNLPLRPGQELVDAAEAEALGTLGEAGLLGPGGDPAIDAAKLLPQVATASSGPLFYRVCSESATKPASCGGPLLLLPLIGLPTRVDVTGDGSVDVSAQLRRTLTGTLDFVVRRVATSETTGTALPAHVWATHDLSATRRLSLGFDGFRRGTTLPQVTSGRFTFGRTLAGQGVLDITGALSQSGAGTAFAVTTGLASLASGTAPPFDPIVASARFSPVPAQFSTHGLVDVAADRLTLDATTNRATELDSIVVADRRTGGVQLDRFSRLTSPMLPGRVAADLTRSSGGPTLRFEASGVEAMAFNDYLYDGPVLDRAVRASGNGLPDSLSISQAGGPGVTLDYDASGPMAELDAGTYDRGTDTVAELSATDLPTSLDLGVDPAADHVSVDASQPLGAGSLALSRGHGSFAPLAKDHVTLVRAGEAYGVSARLTGLRSADAFFGSHPRLTTATETGVGPFVAAGQSSLERSRVEVSNLPADLSVDLDPVARTLAHRGSGAVPLVEAAYVGTAAGPTVSVAMSGAPSSVDVGYDAGQRPGVASAASGPIPRLELFASDDHVTVLQPAVHHYMSLAATDLPATAEIALDLVGSHLEGTQSAALGGLDLVGRAPVGGRTVSAAVDLAGAPSRFDADFGPGRLRMRGLSGPIGSARLAVTNHTGTEIPVGEHLAVRQRQLTGDVDASLLLSGLTHAEYSHGASSQQFRLDAEGPGAWLDTDLRLADGGVDDTQVMLAARIDRLPTSLAVDVAGGALEYSSDHASGLRAEVRIGKVAALTGLGAPLFDNGVAVRARGCAPGPGCLTDATGVCTSFPVCMGIVGTIQLASLPSSVRLDLARHGLAMTGYSSGPSALRAYVATQGVEPVPVAVLATLTGLPSTLDFDLEHVDVAPGSIDLGYTASAAIGSLTVLAESVSGRVVRGSAVMTPVPRSVGTSGTFGSVTEIRQVAAEPVDQLSLQATAQVVGGLASGEARLTDVPATLDLQSTAYGDNSVLGVPSLTYSSGGASSLDGVVQVESALAREVGPAIPGATDIFLRFTNLGADTAITTTPDTRVNFFSVPSTASLEAGSRLESSVASVPLDLQVFDEVGFTGTLSGHVGAPTIHIGDLGLSVTGLRSLSLLPGETAYLSMGVVGDYDVLTLDPSDMFIDPDVEMTLDIDGPGLLNDEIHFSTQDPFTGIRFHLSDQVLRESGCVASEVFGVGTYHLRVFTKPGKIATQVNHIDVFGADGPQALNYLDPIPTPLGQDPALVSMGIDLFTAYVTQPLPGSEVDYDPDFGGC